MSDQAKLDDVLRRIRALRAKAEKTDNEHEAAAFAAKVAEMLAQYGLEEAQLAVEERSGGDIGHEETVIKEWDASPARRLMALAVCRLYMVKPILPARRKGHPWTLIGRKHNIIMTKEMVLYLIDTTIRLSRKWRRENAALASDEIDFRRGCFERLIERVNEIRLRQEQGAQAQFSAQGNPQNLPALYQQEMTMLKQYMKSNFDTRKAKMTGIRTGAAAEHGRSAANSIGLNTQVSGSRPAGGGFLLGKR